MHQHLGSAFSSQAVQHALHPQVLTCQHSFAELEHIETRHIQHRVFNIFETELLRGVQQCQFLNFLVGGQQIALDPIGKKLQAALTFFTGTHTLLL